MSPILLDKRYVVTAVVLFVIFILLSFVGGYVLGYQHYLKITTETKISELMIPAAESASIVNPEENSISSNEPGEHVDVDAPESTVTSVATASVIENDTVIATEEKVISEPVQAESEIDKIIDNASEADAQYSIQVGLYGIKVNAQRRVDELIEQGLSGHLSDFVNSKGDTLYNVRFGYFIDKASVLAALDIYQQNHAGDGYIIRLKK